MVAREVRFCKKCNNNVEFIVVMDKQGKTESMGCVICLSELMETMKRESFASPQTRPQPPPQKARSKAFFAKGKHND